MRNFYQNIHDALHKVPEKELLVFPSKETGTAPVSYTGKDILDRIALFRKAFDKQTGLQAGQKALLVLPVGLDLICALLAVMALGATPVLPPAGASVTRLLRILRQQKIRVLITAQNIPFPLSLLAIGMGIKLLAADKANPSTCFWPPPQPVSANQPALISHSSGSTGKPKPVYRSHRVLQAQHQVLRRLFPPFRGQRDFPLFPNILLHNLAVGTASILPDLRWPTREAFAPERVISQIRHQQVHTLTGNVFYFGRLLHYLQANGLALPQVQALGIGGSPVPEWLALALRNCFPNARVYLIYGSSEAEPIAVREVTASCPPHKGYAVGHFIPSLQWRIQPVGGICFADGTSFPVGQIEVKGAHVAAWRPDSWLQTGDFGYVDAANVLYLTGRKGNEHLHRGVQHYQVEHVLQQLPGIERVAARATPQGFMLYIQGKTAEKTIRQALLEIWPDVLIRGVHFRESLPVDARHQSKILYAKVK